VLAYVEALGLDLLEVRQLTSDHKSPGSGDNRPRRSYGLARGIRLPC
jgi:hypothetical protein